MQDIDYAINLFDKFQMNSYDTKDEAEKFLAMMAYQEICADQRERFNYIISNDRFNEHCFKGLFNLFFNSREKVSNDLVQKYFVELLENNKFNFPLVLHYDSGSDFPNLLRKKELFKYLIVHLISQKIYIAGLYYYLDRAERYNEYYPENGSSLKLIEQYSKGKKGAEIVDSMLYTMSHSSTDLCDECSLDDFEDEPEIFNNAQTAYKILSDLNFISKNKDKQGHALALFSIGLMQSTINNIGQREVIRNYKKSQSVVIYDSENYFNKIPDCFNSPHNNFKECVTIFNNIKKCNFSEKQIDKIINTYYSLFGIIWN